MARFIISLGVINKKMIIPLIYIMMIIVYNLSYLLYKYNEVSLFINGFGFSQGQLLVFFLNIIFKYRRTLAKKKKVPMKQYIKDYSILFLINAFFMFQRLIPYYVVINTKNEYRELFMNDSLEIVFITLITYFFMKYKYYIHHIISLIALVIISVIIDSIP